jgi:hypothetical protein
VRTTAAALACSGPADSHRYGRSPPRGGYSRAPADPHTFDAPATLKQFADWFRYFYPQQAAEEDAADKLAEQEAGDGSKPRNGIKTKWEKYKKDFAVIQVCMPPRSRGASLGGLTLRAAVDEDVQSAPRLALVPGKIQPAA